MFFELLKLSLAKDGSNQTMEIGKTNLSLESLSSYLKRKHKTITSLINTSTKLSIACLTHLRSLVFSSRLVDSLQEPWYVGEWSLG